MKKIGLTLLIISGVLAVTGLTWIVVLKFIHFDTVFTMRLKLIVFWKPAVTMLFAIPFYIVGKRLFFSK